MEGRGKSRRRNTRQEWKRRLSSALAVVLTAAMVLNMPLSIDSLGLHVSNAFASGSNADREGGLWATASNAKYQKGQSQDVDIYVIAEDNEAAPGNTSSMTLYLKNNTGQMITEGTLSFKGNHIAKEDGYFENMGTAQADTPTVIVGGEDPTKQTEASGEGMLYEEDGEDSKESIDGEVSLGDQDGIAGDDDADADANDADDEDAEEEESHKLTDIDLQPGEMREIRFTYYTDDEENSTKAYVEFAFHGEDENEAAVRSSSKFYYSIGLPFVNFSMEDGMQIESGVSNDMEIWMSEPTWVDEALEERIEKQEEEEAEKAYKDEETEPADTASGSNADKASDSNASKDTEDTDTQKDQDKINQYKEEAMTISKVSYDVEIYGAELERFSPRKAEEVEDLGWISCIYEVANHTEPGVYYGKVTANGRWNNRKFTSEQGFLFEVTGEGKTGQEFTKELDKVIVHAYAEEGVLEEGVKLTVEELAKGSEPFSRATEGLDNGDVQYDEDNMLAFDICFVNKNGEEVEPNGDVQVSIEMKKDALPEDIDLETVEVHHIKEFDDTVEAEPVADGADKTDGTVKSAEAVVAELKEAEVDQEEIEAAVSDEAVAVAEFSVGRFSTFTITWTNGKDWGKETYFTVNIHYVDESGKEIDIDREDLANSFSIQFPSQGDSPGISGSQTYMSDPILLSNYEVADLKYGKFLGIHYGSVKGKEVATVNPVLTGNWKWNDYWLVGWWEFEDIQRTLMFKDDSGKIVESLTCREDEDPKSVDIYFVYEETPEVPITTAELCHEKTAEYNEETGNYDLTLTVSGQVGSVNNPAKVDVLLVVDKSGSMAYAMDSESTAEWYEQDRMDAVIEAVGTLTDILDEKVAAGEMNVQYDLVSFSSLSYTNQDKNTGWTETSREIEQAIEKIKRAGGTNYQYAIYRAENALSDPVCRDDAKKIVIFLTDGIPTHKGLSREWQDNNNSNFTNTNAAMNQMDETFQADAFYCIGIGPDFEDDNARPNDSTNGRNNLNKLIDKAKALGIQESYLETTTDPDTLKEIFADIAGSATTYLCSDVEITDTLSKNVQVVLNENNTPKNLLIEIWDGEVGVEGNRVASGQNEVTFLNAEESPVKITAKFIPSENGEDNGTLKLLFPEDYQLQAGYTYTITTTIEATEEAYQTYRDNNCIYVDLADDNTGTHKKQYGLYSNASSNIHYVYNDESHDIAYDDPVIQLHPKDLIISKEIKDIVWNEEDLAEYENQLKFDIVIGDESEEVPLSAFTKDKQTGQYNLTIHGLSPEAQYEVTEKGAEIPGYTLIATNTGNTIGYIPEWNGVETVSVGFTNTYKIANHNLQITKYVEGNMAETDKDFTFKVMWTDSNTESISGIKNTVSEGDEAKQEIIVVENGKTFGLKATESIVFTVPDGLIITIDEDSQNYSPEISGENDDDPSDPSDITLTMNEDKNIIYTNRLTVETPTGFGSHNVPYALMVTVSALMGFGFISGAIARKRRQN